MVIANNTRRILSGLQEVAADYSLAFSTETRLFPSYGSASERVDAVFSLPSGRPVLWFEIDQDSARAAHNRLKIFGDLLQALPVAAVAVHHDRAAVSPTRYSAALVREFILPPRFLDAVNLTPEQEPVDELRRWIRRLFDRLAFSPEWGSALGIVQQYQPLVRNASLELAVAHLEAQAELAWFLASKGNLPKERYACLCVALGRMLQRSGHHRMARRQMRLLAARVGGTELLSTDTADDVRAVTLLLTQPDFDNQAALKHLVESYAEVRSVHHRSRFLWRQAIPWIVAGRLDRAQDLAERYQDLMPNSPVVHTNIALLETLTALLLGVGDPREAAARYAGYERLLLEEEDGPPDGTVHGVVTSLYLRVVAEVAIGNDDPAALLSEIDDFRRMVALPHSADGLREIGVALQSPRTSRTLPGSRRLQDGLRLTELSGRTRRETLSLLCAKVDVACRRG